MSIYPYNDQLALYRRRLLRKSSTDAERKLWTILRNRQMEELRFFRQYSVGPYILDFYCPARRLALEIDGGQHAENFYKQHDNQRTEFLVANDIRVLRFWNTDVLQNLDGVWQMIQKAVRD